MSARKNENWLLVLAVAGILVIGLAITGKVALGHPQQKSQGFPDLVGGLKAVPGCLA